MNKKKILSLIMALVMLVGVFSPLTAFAEEKTVTKEQVIGKITTNDVQKDKPGSTNLTIHKLVADSYNKGVPVDHNGGTLSDDQKALLGTNVKGLPGVKFTIYKIENDEDFKTIQKDAPKTTTAMENYVKAGQATLVKETEATGADGSVSESLKDGNYWVVESGRPSRVTESKAVPFAITLPLLNQVDVKEGETVKYKAGTVYMTNVHVYPKNIEKKPEMDKAFGKLDKNSDKFKDVDSKTYKEWIDEWKAEYGPQVDQYTRDKKTIDARVGSKVPYEVKTSLKAGQIYKTLSWSDIMTNGLKYNKDLSITYKLENAQDEKTITIANPSTKTESDFGFDVVIKDDATIKAINDALATGNVEITLKYTATLTRDAVVDLPESNNITFTPGEPKHENNNTPISPTSGNLTVTKTWADGKTPDNVLVTYILFEGTDKPIASVTLKGTTIQSKSLPEGVTVTNNGYNVTFSGLDDKKTYKIEEFADGYDPEYKAANAVENKVNPDTITPTPPQVETYGKKFVKTDASAEKNRLAGAEFVVKNGTGSDAKYLVAKTGSDIAKNQKAVTDAKDALDKAIAAYNKLEKAQQTDEKRTEIENLQKTYNDAYKTAGNIYEWGNRDDAIVLVSDGNGKFEITGLATGTYYLEEVKAPEGFAKLTSDTPFTVGSGTYTSDTSDKKIDYVPESGKNDALQVENKNLTIPQTGGIGTVLFTVVGIGLMGGAVMAMKKNREEA